MVNMCRANHKSCTLVFDPFHERVAWEDAKYVYTKGESLRLMQKDKIYSFTFRHFSRQTALNTGRHETLIYETDSMYRQVSNISRAVTGNNIVDHSDVVGASPVGAAHAASSFST